ncbi:pickpocket protein 28-like [Photinus pyralis]|uniref:pickpocket protein 28-like n=1 Tax=Photinus pyralis TaxID=7054 RepID=UPI0012673E05|nr:pickpocket protein 28-like [Photinus pyralis]
MKATKKTWKPDALCDRSKFENWKTYLVQYCESTTIHGIKYVGERGRFIVERLLWIAVLIVVCACCVTLIHKMYSKWTTSPTVVTFAKSETPIHQIPFPAVTICPEAKFNPEVFNITEMVLRNRQGGNFSTHELEQLELAYLICDRYFDTSNWSNTLPYNGENTLFRIQPYFAPLRYARVTWLGSGLSSYEAFVATYTSEGVCYTFNMLPYEEIMDHEVQFNTSHHSSKSRQWSLEGGYPPGDNFDAYPRRTFMSGVEGGLIVDSTAHRDPLFHR